MAQTTSSILVVDVEALCWDKDDQQNRPQIEHREIIEIGVAVYDVKTGGVSQNVSILVKPRFGKVSEFCTNLTGWTQEDVDTGLDIEEALDFCKKEFKMDAQTLWASYGEYDRWKLTTRYGRSHDLKHYYGPIASPFDDVRGHINVKSLFAMKNKLSKELGLGAAVNFIGERFTGRHHNGADDARNICNVLRTLLN